MKTKIQHRDFFAITTKLFMPHLHLVFHDKTLKQKQRDFKIDFCSNIHVVISAEDILMQNFDFTEN